MSVLRNFEMLLEAHGEALTVGDLRLPGKGLFEQRFHGLCIQSGAQERLKTHGSAGLGALGSLSLFAGTERVGTLNWDCEDQARAKPVDWTPLSKNYRSSISEGTEVDAKCRIIKLRVGPAAASQLHRERMDVSPGHLGFAGI